MVPGRSTSEVPRLVLPDDLFVNVALSIGSQLNQFLGFIQDVACGRNLKQFILVRKLLVINYVVLST